MKSIKLEDSILKTRGKILVAKRKGWLPVATKIVFVYDSNFFLQNCVS